MKSQKRTPYVSDFQKFPKTYVRFFWNPTLYSLTSASEENLIFKHLFLLKFSTYDVEHVYRYKYVTKQHTDSRCTNISTHPHPISDCKNKRQKKRKKKKVSTGTRTQEVR